MPQVYHAVQLRLIFETKVCVECHIEKPLSDFHKDPRYTGGYRNNCMACRNKRRKERNEQRVCAPPPERQCTKCRQVKPIDAFYKNRDARDGYSRTCKVCDDAYEDALKGRPPRQKFVKGNNLGGKETKWCYGCQQEHPLLMFPADRTKKDGKATRCKECVSKRDKIYHRAHREHRLRANRHYRRTHFPPKGRFRSPYGRIPIGCNPQDKRAYNIAYTTANRERILANKKVYYASHKMQVRQNGSKYRARKRAAVLGKVDFQRVLLRDGHVCHICNKAVAHSDIHFDHVIPLSRGGSHSEENIKVAHSVCNLRKNDKLMEELTPFDRRGV